jgi:hypothetical protein
MTFQVIPLPQKWVGLWMELACHRLAEDFLRRIEANRGWNAAGGGDAKRLIIKGKDT